MQIALLNGAAEAALAHYGVSSLDGLEESDLQGLNPVEINRLRSREKLGFWTSEPPSRPVLYLLWVIDPKITQ